MPVESIFTTQLPAQIDLQDANYTLGTLFVVDAPGVILGTRIYTGNEFNDGCIGTLYRWEAEHQGTLLASKVFDTSKIIPNSWNSILFDSPVTVVPGTKYVTAFSTHSYVATGGFFNSHSITSGHLYSPADGELNAGNGRFYVGGLAFPDQVFNAGCYFIDTLFQADGEEPEPSSNQNRFFFASA